MIINHNISALNAHRQLGANQNAVSSSLEKLSSGLGINKAGDDAAGLAISEKMRGQIQGLEMASKNAQDANSLIQTAEGALNETHSILQRMRELSVQSANDTNTAEDRKNIQDEMDQLTKEIDRISSTTQFNTKNLIDGSMGSAVNTAVANESTSAIIKSADVAATGTSAFNTLQDSNGNSLGIESTDTIEVSYVMNGTTTTIDLDGDDTLGDITDANLAATVEADGSIKITADDVGFANAIHGITVTVKDADGNVRSSATDALSSFTETKASADVRTDGTATFQIGSNTGQNIQLSIEDMSTAALGVKDLKVSTQGQANVAITVIDSAIQKVSAERSKLGATQNRLDHTINNLGTSAENLTAAESRIRDVDMAKEMMEFTKNNILSQAAQSMLAQSNQMPQGVLQLLQ